MGVRWSTLLAGLGWRRQVRVLMLGLDNAGKSTILYRLKLGEHIDSVPTVGFNCERVTYRNLTFVVWDCGGQDVLRQLWRHFYKDTQGLIFVIDSHDLERLDEAKRELGRLMTEDELSGAALLVFANKQDLPHALRGAGIAERLELHKLDKTGRTWHLQESCAVNGKGLYDGLEWLAKHL